jgi:hypothetical protein
MAAARRTSTTRQARKRRQVSNNDEPYTGHWHLDKRVNVSIIVALALQGAIGLTWANRLTFDVEALKLTVNDLHQSVKKQDSRLDRVIAIDRVVARMEETLKGATEKLNRINVVETRLESVGTQLLEIRESRRRIWEELRKKQNIGGVVAPIVPIPERR